MPNSRQSNHSADFSRSRILRHCDNAIYSVDLCTMQSDRRRRNIFWPVEMMVVRWVMNLEEEQMWWTWWDIEASVRRDANLLTCNCIVRPLQCTFSGQNLFQRFPHAFLARCRIGQCWFFKWRFWWGFTHFGDFSQKFIPIKLIILIFLHSLGDTVWVA